MAATSTATTPVATQTRPLFPAEPVEYMYLNLEDDHLLIIDKHAALAAGTLKGMIEAQASLDGLVAQDDNTPMTMDLKEHGIPAMQVIADYVYWRKRWINVVVEKIQIFPIPRENRDLVQQAAVSAHFLEV